ncbi:Kinesin-like protein NACK1 [Capsicum chinense]|nr:Kinesin-like protein NACK1 [Capsicum chinense]
MQGAALGSEEKILVLVRLRPLSEKEITRNEVSDWECINETTILYRNNLKERFGLPIAYTIDRVYKGDCSTREVYEEGTKEIALSVVSGIYSTIFAYGQTSSGNTYTMNGITEFTVTDIYHYMQKIIESSAREFIGKDNKTTLFASVGIHGHVNYRDSKLTRIFQPTLGGNARTAIIFTLGTAQSHVEQSQNTLLFACCAKEVTTNAQVNVVMSDKALVKHLQKELARLESELKNPTTTCDHVVLLRTKDQQIEKTKRFEAKIFSLEDSKDVTKLSPSDLVHTLQAQEQRRSLRLEEATKTVLQAKFQMQKEGSVKLADKTKLEIVGKRTVAIEAPKDVEIKQITSQENPQKLQNNKEALTKDNPHTVAGTTSGYPDSGDNNSSNLDLTFYEDQKYEDDGIDNYGDVSNYDDVDDYLSESHCKNDSVSDNASPHFGTSQKCGSTEETEHSSGDVSLDPAT